MNGSSFRAKAPERGNPFTYWWVYIPPTAALILFGVGWNLLGDGLNAMLNPRQRR